MEMQNRILIKSHELFLKYGIRSVSMDEIASQLGISKKTIYQSYADKNALVSGVIDIEIDRTHRECAYHRSACLDAVHEIFLAMDMMQEMLSNINPVLLYDLEKFHPQAFQKFKEQHNQFLYQVLKNNLERGMEEQVYRSGFNTDILARYRLGSMFLVFNNDYFTHGKYLLNEIVAVMTDNFLHGLVTEKGKQLIEQYTIQRQTIFNTNIY